MPKSAPPPPTIDESQFDVVGDLSDDAIDAIADLLLDLVERGERKAQEEPTD